MNRPKLRIGVVKSWDGYYEATGCFMRLPEGSCRKPGFEIEIFAYIMHLLKWKYELIETDDYGYFDQNYPTNWSGLIGLALEDKIDASAVAVRITNDRMKVVDFSLPLHNYYQAFYFQTPKDQHSPQFLLAPFRQDVYWAIFCSLFLVALVQTIFSKLFRPEISTISTLIDHLFRFYSLLFQQTDPTYRFSSAITLSKIWIFGAFVVAVYYKIICYTFLAVPLHIIVPFTTIKELTAMIEQNKYHLTYTEAVIRPECTPKVCERLEKALKYNPIRTDFLNQLINHSTAVATGVFFEVELPHHTAFMKLPYMYGLFVNATYCIACGEKIVGKSHTHVVVRDPSMEPHYLAFIFRKNSPYRHKFNEALTHVWPAINTIKARYPMLIHDEKLNERHSTGIVITLKHFQEKFVELSYGMCIASVAFVLELIYFAIDAIFSYILMC